MPLLHFGNNFTIDLLEGMTTKVVTSSSKSSQLLLLSRDFLLQSIDLE